MITGSKEDIEKTKGEIKQNFHRFIGGVLSAVPFCGLLAADKYLGFVNNTSYHFGISKEDIPSFLSETVAEMTFFPGKILFLDSNMVERNDSLIMSSAELNAEEVYGVTGKDGLPYHTDGCNNVKKMESYNGTLVCFGGNQDVMMGKNKNENGDYQLNFSDELANAYHGKNLTHTKIDEPNQPMSFKYIQNSPVLNPSKPKKAVKPAKIEEPVVPPADLESVFGGNLEDVEGGFNFR